MGVNANGTVQGGMWIATRDWGIRVHDGVIAIIQSHLVQYKKHNKREGGKGSPCGGIGICRWQWGGMSGEIIGRAGTSVQPRVLPVPVRRKQS
jgi:hypothetical protein